MQWTKLLNVSLMAPMALVGVMAMAGCDHDHGDHHGGNYGYNNGNRGSNYGYYGNDHHGNVYHDQHGSIHDNDR